MSCSFSSKDRSLCVCVKYLNWWINLKYVSSANFPKSSERMIVIIQKRFCLACYRLEATNNSAFLPLYSLYKLTLLTNFIFAGYYKHYYSICICHFVTFRNPILLIFSSTISKLKWNTFVAGGKISLKVLQYEYIPVSCILVKM